MVFSQEDIARWGGVGNVEKLRKNGGYSDGGVVGVTRMSNEDADRRRFNSTPKNSSQGEGSGDIKIEVNITDSGVNTSGGNTQDQRQFAQVVGNAVRAVIIREKRQGGLLSK